MNKHDLIILFSGGADSRLLLELAIEVGRQPYCVLVDYGQKHKEELTVARRCLDRSRIEYTLVLASFPIKSKLTSSEFVKYEGVSEWYVPSRNLMLISFALSVAESLAIDTVWYGADYNDREDLFPDCYQEWVVRLNNLLEVNSSRRIKVEAPLLGYSKELILELLRKKGVKDNEIFSGYGDVEEST